MDIRTKIIVMRLNRSGGLIDVAFLKKVGKVVLRKYSMLI